MNDLCAALRGNHSADVWPLLIHAHPDDETIQTGALLAWFQAVGIKADVLTCTRGERGEVVPGVLPSSITTEDLLRVRERELNAAMDLLGVSRHYWLGSDPARLSSLSEVRYSDSGMRWISEGLAGPAADTDAESFSVMDIESEVVDLVALIQHVKPTVLISYDAGGSYGHPDHVRAHEITKLASQRVNLPMVEVASGSDQPGFEYYDLSQYKDLVKQSLRCYASQLTVVEDEIVHVGGQHQPIELTIGLRYDLS